MTVLFLLEDGRLDLLTFSVACSLVVVNSRGAALKLERARAILVRLKLFNWLWFDILGQAFRIRVVSEAHDCLSWVHGALVVYWMDAFSILRVKWLQLWNICIVGAALKATGLTHCFQSGLLRDVSCYDWVGALFTKDHDILLLNRNSGRVNDALLCQLKILGLKRCLSCGC